MCFLYFLIDTAAVIIPYNAVSVGHMYKTSQSAREVELGIPVRKAFYAGVILRDVTIL